MVTKSQKIRLGVFAFIAVVVAVAVIAAIVAPKLFQERDVYYIGYRDSSLTGLQEGSSVKYHGLSVGFVSDIYIDPEDIRRVIVEVSLEQDTPIKTDTRAAINMLGITGLKFIELRGGSNEAESLKPGGFIQSGQSITEQITGRAEVIAEKAELVLNNLASMTGDEQRQEFALLTLELTNTLQTLNQVMGENQESFSVTMTNAENISEDLHTVVLGTQEIVQQANRLAKSDTLSRIMGNLIEISESLKEADMVQVIQDLNQALAHTNRMLGEFETAFSKSRVDLFETIESMRESSEHLNQFTRQIAEDPSVLVRGSRPKNAPDYDLE
jgi:phospholipid/cholesterol/gamma-HCH transport system substrate-binding protein